jgi:hypothetical protein
MKRYYKIEVSTFDKSNPDPLLRGITQVETDKAFQWLQREIEFHTNNGHVVQFKITLERTNV